MRTLVAVCWLLFFSRLWAADVSLAWDPSPIGITNYVLYAHTNVLSAKNLHTSVLRKDVGTNLAVTVEGLDTGRWCLGITAMKNGIQSQPATILVEVTRPPLTVILQHGNTLTNFQDVGFFRLRWP